MYFHKNPLFLCRSSFIPDRIPSDSIVRRGMGNGDEVFDSRRPSG